MTWAEQNMDLRRRRDEMDRRKFWQQAENQKWMRFDSDLQLAKLQRQVEADHAKQASEQAS